MSSSSFLVSSKSFRTNFKSGKFSELVLLNYCCLIVKYMEFLLEKTFVIFDGLSINNFKVYAVFSLVLN